ncbi:unnamed protein product [Albugo candida]|uniref:Uncharacterized protein n=1 Tax=Albugo candida TaxID=65357 RepID=A0A024GGD3_9STRA|nr:unnamed protein product [Albugo candida]|eukprot:CCI45598.1 unnamed protein product [Albugo candida]
MTIRLCVIAVESQSCDCIQELAKINKIESKISFGNVDWYIVVLPVPFLSCHLILDIKHLNMFIPLQSHIHHSRHDHDEQSCKYIDERGAILPALPLSRTVNSLSPFGTTCSSDSRMDHTAYITSIA